jgi:hypothetical protein
MAMPRIDGAAMSNVLLAIIGWDPKGWDQRFRIKGPQHKIRMWPEHIAIRPRSTMPASGTRRMARSRHFPT